jgi:hypothetical protein
VDNGLGRMKDRLGDQRGGSEWEPIKILLGGYELGLYPKFTTTDSHTSFPRSCSHNGPTNPRNKPQLNPTRKHNSKSKGLRQSGKRQEDRPQCPGRLSARRARTVRNCYPNLQYCTEKNGPSVMDPRTVRHSSTDRPQTSCTKNPPTKWIERKALKNSHEHEEQSGCQAPRRRSAVTSRTVRDYLVDGPR